MLLYFYWLTALINYTVCLFHCHIPLPPGTYQFFLTYATADLCATYKWLATPDWQTLCPLSHVPLAYGNYKWYLTPVPLAHTTPYHHMIIFIDICIATITSTAGLATRQVLVFITSGTVGFTIMLLLWNWLPFNAMPAGEKGTCQCNMSGIPFLYGIQQQHTNSLIAATYKVAHPYKSAYCMSLK